MAHDTYIDIMTLHFMQHCKIMILFIRSREAWWPNVKCTGHPVGGGGVLAIYMMEGSDLFFGLKIYTLHIFFGSRDLSVRFV